MRGEPWGVARNRTSLGRVRQYYAELVHDLPLLFGHDQKLESAAQAVTITHHGAELHGIGFERDGKLQGNNFAGLHLAAEGCADAIEAEFVGPAPVFDGQALAEYRHLDPGVKTIAGKPPFTMCRFGGGRRAVVQSGFSMADSLQKPNLRLCLSARVLLNGIKVHVPKTITSIRNRRLVGALPRVCMVFQLGENPDASFVKLYKYA